MARTELEKDKINANHLRGMTIQRYQTTEDGTPYSIGYCEVRMAYEVIVESSTILVPLRFGQMEECKLSALAGLVHLLALCE